MKNALKATKHVFETGGDDVVQAVIEKYMDISFHLDVGAELIAKDFKLGRINILTRMEAPQRYRN